jgi:uncharacterized protein
MYNKLLYIFIFLSFGVFAQKDIPERPSPPRLVNDFVGNVLSQSEINALEQKLRGYADSTSTQITIVIAADLNGYEPIEYAYRIGDKWGVGQKGKDNGIVLLWCPKDRKLAIATGQGVQGRITDGYAGAIIDKVIRPNFRNLQYYKGLDDATTKIFERLTGEFKAKKRQADGDGDDFLGIFIFLIFVIIIIYIINKNNRNGGNGRRSYHDRGDGGGWMPYVIFGNGGSSSGGWSSGGGGGGGFDFGGFGGGGFDGGGASGDY